MGDARRFEVVSAFVRSVFPNVRRIADVAGGQGYLAWHLTQAGYEAEVIDPRETDLSRPERRVCRKKGYPFTRRRGLFQASQALGFDLVVGLHPDGATAEMAQASLFRPVVVVPCCNYWPGVSGDPVEALRSFWTQHQILFQEAVLPMQGRNLVMWTTT